VPHSVPFTLSVAGLLWFGWFRFNAGSALAASDLAVKCVRDDAHGGRAGLRRGFSRPHAHRPRDGRWCRDRRSGGLVASQPAAGFVSPRAALAIAACAALASYGQCSFAPRTSVDDTLDVLPATGWPVSWARCSPESSRRSRECSRADGLFSGGGFHQLGIQAIAVLVTVVLSGALTAGIIVVIRATARCDGSVADGSTAMDASEHGEEAYHAGDLGEMGGSAGALGQGVVLVPAVGSTARARVA